MEWIEIYKCCEWTLNDAVEFKLIIETDTILYFGRLLLWLFKFT